MRRIINAHAHVLASPYKGLPDGMLGLDALAEDMKRGGIEKSFVFSSFGEEGGKYDYDWVELSKRIEERGGFELIYSVHSDDEGTIRMVDNALDEGTLRGVKVPLGYQHIYPNDKRLHPFYDSCEEYGRPVIFHTGGTFGGRAKAEYVNPLNVDGLAVDRPGLKIVIAHVGNPLLDEAALVMEKNPNVFGDLSGLFVQYKGENDFEDLRYRRSMVRKINDLIAHVGGDKFLFGTDFPLADSVSCLKFFDELDFTEEEKKRTLYKNALELFEL